MDCSILKNVIDAFNKLWDCEILDEKTLRIQAPYISLANQAIHLYIKLDDEEFTVSDGGFLEESAKTNFSGTLNKRLFSRIVETYIEERKIEAKEIKKNVYYFKKTKEIPFLPNIIFEMSDFAKAYLDSLHIGTSENRESQTREVLEFEKNSKNYLKEHYEKREHFSIEFDVSLGTKVKRTEVSAAIMTPNKSWNAVQFISGGKPAYFRSKTADVTIGYSLISDFEMVQKRYAVYDDTSQSYQESKVEIDAYLGELGKQLTNGEAIPKSKIGNITELII